MFSKAWNALDDFGQSGYGTLAALAISVAITALILLAAL